MKWVVTGIIGVTILLLGIFVLIFNSQQKANPHSSTHPDSTLSDMVGKPAPDFTLQTYDDKTYSLNGLRGKKVVLFFSEGIMCYPACLNQIAALGSDTNLNNDKIVTLSIVPDSKKEWLEAAERMPELGKEAILLDTDKAVSDKYNMLNQPSSMHRGMMPGHTYIIIDENGVVRYTLDDPKMSIQNQGLLQEISAL